MYVKGLHNYTVFPYCINRKIYEYRFSSRCCRFCAITKPLKYGVKRTPRRMIVYVSLVWLGAACISLPPLLIMGNEHTYSESGPSHCVVCQNFFYQIYATLGSFYIPLLVMIQVRYCWIYRDYKIIETCSYSSFHLHSITFV